MQQVQTRSVKVIESHSGEIRFGDMDKLLYNSRLYVILYYDIDIYL